MPLTIDAYWLLPSVLSVFAALALALCSAARMPFERWHLAVVFLSTAVVHGAYAVALGAPHVAVLALQVAFGGSILQATFLVTFGKSLLGALEGKAPEGVRHKTLVPLTVAALLGLVLVLPQGLYELEPVGLGRVAAGGVGHFVCGALLIELLFGLAGLERLLRRVRDPLYYQVKLLLLGLGVLAAIGLYTTSSFLLRAVWRPEFALAHSSVTLLGLALAAVGLFRLRRRTDGHRLVDSSESSRPLSFAIAGVFLLAMGIAGALLPSGATMSEHVLGVTVAAATGAALAVALASRYVRTVLKRFLARTFRKAKYDYRNQWLQVIQAFHGVTSVDAILDRLVDLLGRTFSATRISVWMQSDADRRFHQARSVNVEAPPAPLEPTHPLIVAASASPEVIRRDDPIAQDDDFCRATEMRVVGPIWGGRLLGLVVLSEDVQGKDYDQDDVDLLHAVSNHVGVLIAHAQLAASHRADAEMRALGELSLFCVHDLKNLAGRLSLVAQNAKRFGDDPEFQRSALHTVATTGERMMSLIQKLSPSAEPPSTRTTDGVQSTGEAQTDLFEVLASATETLKEGIHLRLPQVPEPRPKVRLPREALRNVLLNIVTNAEQALGNEGQIAVSVAAAEGQWVVSVRDNGPGIEPRALARLFEPFGSTKPSGLGVGLYQCRRTLEDAGGSIVVESRAGLGTMVKLSLPASSPAGQIS